MKFPDYILENEQGVLRWKNWNDFLKGEKKIRYKKQNKTAIICLFYSSLDNIKILSEYISKEKYRDDFDFIIINNSPIKDTNFEKELQNNNVIILAPVANLGTDGGYGIGLEYVIKHKYDYVFIIEDDVILLDEQAFSDVYNNMDKKSVGFIYPRINEGGEQSRYVQFACYSIAFLKICGILDPRFFTRGGDGERAPKIEETIKRLGYKKIIINKKHLHPYLKKNNRNTRWIYFAWRNIFWSIKESKRISGYTMIMFFIYIWNGISKLLFKRSSSILKALFYAIKDFLFASRTLELSLDRMNILSHIKIPIPTKIKDINVSSDEINTYTKDLYVVGGFSPHDLKKIQGSKKINNFFTKGIVIPNINSPLYPICLLSRKIIIINEFNFDDNTVNIYVLKNSIIIGIFKSMISLFLSIIIFLIYFIIIIIKILYYKVSGLVCRKN